MNDKILISGFADEIAPQLDAQLPVVTGLGMRYICLRAADGKGIADYSLEEFQEKILPRLKAAGVGISSLGSPIGKIAIDDEEAYAAQLEQLDTLCQICQAADCRYIRMFSFWMPKGEDPAAYTDKVLEKLAGFARVAEKYGVILLHENEKDIYGDTGARCKIILEKLASPHFKAAFDFANFVQCGEDPAQCWELLKDQVVYIHIKDAVVGSNANVLCGTGDGKIAEILKKAIREEGYEGFLTLEPHLALFDTFKSLEAGNLEEIMAKMGSGARNGTEGFTKQYNALVEILKGI